MNSKIVITNDGVYFLVAALLTWLAIMVVLEVCDYFTRKRIEREANAKLSYHLHKVKERENEYE